MSTPVDTSVPHPDPAREEQELRAYLGDAFDRAHLERYEQHLDEEFARIGDEDRFYRSSEAYLYNLTAFAMTGTKTPYLGELTSKLPPGARILDYGCGIGSDGLALLEAGYEVEFADFDNPSTRYLRWRLARRGLDVPVHDLDAGVPGGFDGAYAFDVLEHLTDPVAVLEQIEQRTALVCVNLLEPAEDEPAVHHTLPIGGLLRRIARFELVGYRIYHGRSHLLTYRPVVARGAALLASRARLVAGRARRGGAALGSRRG